MDETILIRIAGIVGIAGSALVFVADLLFLGSRRRRGEFNAFLVMRTKSDRTIVVGHTLGVLALPLCVIGFLPLFVGLKPASTLSAFIVSAGLAYMMSAGSGIHGAYAPIGFLLKTRDGHPAAAPALDELHAAIMRSFIAVVKPATIVYFIASFAFSAMIVSGRTIFPLWLALWCPAAMTALVRYAYNYLPFGLGGWVSPACVHVVLLPLFVITTTFAWNA